MTRFWGSFFWFAPQNAPKATAPSPKRWSLPRIDDLRAAFEGKGRSLSVDRSSSLLPQALSQSSGSMPRARISENDARLDELEEALDFVMDDPDLFTEAPGVLEALLDEAHILESRTRPGDLARARFSVEDKYRQIGGEAFRDLFRFDFDVLPLFQQQLGIPEQVRLQGRTTLPGLKVLAITLQRLARPYTLATLETFWGESPAVLCEASNWCVTFIHER